MLSLNVWAATHKALLAPDEEVVAVERVSVVAQVVGGLTVVGTVLGPLACERASIWKCGSEGLGVRGVLDVDVAVVFVADVALLLGLQLRARGSKIIVVLAATHDDGAATPAGTSLVGSFGDGADVEEIVLGCPRGNQRSKERLRVGGSSASSRLLLLVPLELRVAEHPLLVLHHLVLKVIQPVVSEADHRLEAAVVDDAVDVEGSLL